MQLLTLCICTHDTALSPSELATASRSAYLAQTKELRQQKSSRARLAPPLNLWCSCSYRSPKYRTQNEHINSELDKEAYKTISENGSPQTITNKNEDFGNKN
eukprot:1112541-Amphidinium_carterae.1